MSHINLAVNTPSNSTSSVRSSGKGHAVTGLANQRRQREVKAVQLRKERRVERIAIQRRKMGPLVGGPADVELAPVDQMPGGTMDSAGSQSAPVHLDGSISIRRSRLAQVLPQKTQQLLSADPMEQMEGTIYVRRVLAIERQPPIDEVLAQPQLLPALLSFLTRWEMPQLQIEAAWCLTNIACGKSRHIALLLQHNTVEVLLEVLQANALPITSSGLRQASVSKGAILRDQLLWALSNITVDEVAAQRLLRLSDSLLPLLCEIDLRVQMTPVEVSTHTDEGEQIDPSGSVDDVVQTTTWAREIIYQSESTATNPSLSTMRYIAFICGNILRLRIELSAHDYTRLIFALSELMHSPDEEVTLDVCSSFLTVCHEHYRCCLPILLEYGVVSRMKECLLEYHAPSSIGVKTEDSGVRVRQNKVGVSEIRHGSSPHFDAENDESVEHTGNVNNLSVYEMVLLVISAILQLQLLGDDSLPVSAAMSLRAACRIILLPTLSHNLVMKTARTANSVFGGGVVQHMVSSLYRPRSSDSTRTDICRGLRGLMCIENNCISAARGAVYATSEMLSHGIFDGLAVVVEYGSNDAATAAGQCLCRLLAVLTDRSLCSNDGDSLNNLSKHTWLLHHSNIPPLQILRLISQLCSTSDQSLLADVLLYSRLLVLDLCTIVKWHAHHNLSLAEHLHPRLYHGVLNVIAQKIDDLLTHSMPDVATLCNDLEAALDSFSELR